MNQHLHSELKKEFQLERLILFSDAVFAIAITLLVIEIKIPEIHENISDKALLHALHELIPKFIGFIISFMFIGLYWSIHHRMFGVVENYDRRLLVLNLVFLFFIVLMPFSTGFYSNYMGGELVEKQLKVPITFYALNFSFAGFANYFLWRHISNPKNKLLGHVTDELALKMAKRRSLVVPCVFLLILPIAYFINVLVAVYVPMLIPIVLKIAKRFLYKKEKKLNTISPQHHQ